MNRLQHETSPYLLQHAHNPVDWYAWKPEAFERARTENKPVIVSIGYATCHWCHVMERESFENEEVAAFMNAHFVCIKVDREERPDVDMIYMEACQIINQSGGWPLNCFLTPEGKPFFAGTYFPPNPMHNRPSWLQALKNLSDAFTQKREIVEEQAAKLTAMIEKGDKALIQTSNDENITTFNTENKFPKNSTSHVLDIIFAEIGDRSDIESGGFGTAPKFPQTHTLQFLLDYYFYSKNTGALNHVVFTIDRMMHGGIYDQVGGGLSRYATDNDWLIPHFEKMLYDNALWIQTLATVYKIKPTTLLKQTITDTLEFVLRELSSFHDNNAAYGFYAGIDADSEGKEGAFYVWNKKELKKILGKNAEIFCALYHVTETGNWEHTNILWRTENTHPIAQQFGKTPEELAIIRKESLEKLFQKRSKRERPITDTKMLLSWNALMISGYAKASEALHSSVYADIAENVLNFVLTEFKKETGAGYYRTVSKNVKQYDAFLEDYAFLIEALLDVYAVNFKKDYVDKAQQLSEYVLENFLDKTDNLFFFTEQNQKDLILRKKDIFDNATPSGNSTMSRNFLRLSVLLGNDDYKKQAEKMVQNVSDAVKKYPTSLARWASVWQALVHSPTEIGIIGKNAFDKARQLNKYFIPNNVLMADDQRDEKYPLLRHNLRIDADNKTGEAQIFVCQNFTCLAPVESVHEAWKLIFKSMKYEA